MLAIDCRGVRGPALERAVDLARRRHLRILVVVLPPRSVATAAAAIASGALVPADIGTWADLACDQLIAEALAVIPTDIPVTILRARTRRQRALRRSTVVSASDAMSG